MNIKRRSLRAAVLAIGLAAALSAGTGMSYAQTSGTGGIGSGNQVAVPVNGAVDACGNAVGVIGGALAQCQGGAAVTDGDQNALDGAQTNGRHGILSGNQVAVPVNGAVDACGNAVGAIGGALAHCPGGASVSGDSSDALDGAHTNGRYGVLSGNQAGVPVTVPADVCGNAVAAVGGALTDCQGGASVTGDDDSYGPLSVTRSDSATPAPGTAATLPIVGGLLPQLPTLPSLGQ